MYACVDSSSPPRSAFECALVVIIFRPLTIVAFLYKIAKPIPLELAKGDRATEFYLAIINPDNLPISLTRSIMDVNFLSDFKRVQSEKNDFMGNHFSDKNDKG
jgi:hypothetical protein